METRAEFIDKGCRLFSKEKVGVKQIFGRKELGGGGTKKVARCENGGGEETRTLFNEPNYQTSKCQFLSNKIITQ